MRIASLLLAAAGGIATVSAAGAEFLEREQWARAMSQQARSSNLLKRPNNPVPKKTPSMSVFRTTKSEKFVVDGNNIPHVNFDIGESYAGTLSIDNNATSPNQLFFWFFPSSQPQAEKEIVVWLNGGPGCSSLEGLIQENGPFLWQGGTFEPQPNPYSWTNLTNVIYIDQPLGVGFSPSTKDAPRQITNETVVAEQFMGFWENLVDTFGLEGYKIYLTGESYAGMYVPYIAKYMLETNDTTRFDVRGIQINDPVFGDADVQTLVPAVAHMNAYNNVLNLNASFVATMNAHADRCGYTAYMEQALAFPPTAALEPPANAKYPGCSLCADILAAMRYVNPCFNMYHLTDFCPYMWNVMGHNPSGGPNNFFAEPAVQRALHAPATDYVMCGDPDLSLRGDTSPPSALEAIPYVIERTNNVLIAHGMLDFLLLANGTLMTIQNMTWHGQQGFQTRPAAPFLVPYSGVLTDSLHAATVQTVFPAPTIGLAGGAGVMGTTHTERGLTYVTVDSAGHMIPQYAPGAAYRQLEFLLGRVKSLTEEGSFTTESGTYTGTSPIY